MTYRKRLQVFVSSTYTDLLTERQAAVEAILTAGHIPAGMELFAAGDESQLNVIKRWIDESDVYLLILGGRYGSVEPQSGKSYTHLEYEYAVQTNKPLFGVVINEAYLDEKVKKGGRTVIEEDNPHKLKEFRSEVKTRMIRFFNDPKDIKLAIMETMSEFARREDLQGWIPGDQAVNTGALAEELARLAKENENLRLKVASLSQLPAAPIFNGLTFDELYQLLLKETSFPKQLTHVGFLNNLRAVANCLGDEQPALVHLFWVLQDRFIHGHEWMGVQFMYPLLARLHFYGLIEFSGLGTTRYFLTNTGRQFLHKMMLNPEVDKAKNVIDKNLVDFTFQ